MKILITDRICKFSNGKSIASLHEIAAIQRICKEQKQKKKKPTRAKREQEEEEKL